MPGDALRQPNTFRGIFAIFITPIRNPRYASAPNWFRARERDLAAQSFFRPSWAGEVLGLAFPRSPAASCRAAHGAASVSAFRFPSIAGLTLDQILSIGTIVEGSSRPLGGSSRRVGFVEEHMPLTDNQSRERIRELNRAICLCRTSTLPFHDGA